MVSIIIPVYNAARTLNRCIKSAVNQSYKDIEIILINDGSKDDSGNICEVWVKRDKRIKAFHKENAGVSSARNLGLEVAQGKFIMMLDSDDELTLDACQVLVKYQSKTDVDCIIFGFYGNRAIAPLQYVHYKSLKEFRQDFSKWLNEGLISSSVNKFYKKEFIKDYYPQDISFGEDLVFCLSYLEQCQQILFITDVLYLYDTSDNTSLTRSIHLNKIYDIEYWQTAVLKFAGNKKKDSDLFKKYIEDTLNYIRELYCCRTISYNEKKKVLKQWYPSSYMKRINISHQGSTFYKLLLYFIHGEHWFFPQMILWIIRYAHRISNTLVYYSKKAKK